jgi:hypothetical protein
LIFPSVNSRHAHCALSLDHWLLIMDEKLDISLEFERIYDELTELSKWSDLADDTLGLLIVLMQENYRLQQERRNK